MLDLEKVKEDFVATEGVINCLQMGIIFLRNEKDIKKFTPEMVDDFIETIVGIWKPEGDEKAEKKKKEAVIELEKILPGLQKNIEKYIFDQKYIKNQYADEQSMIDKIDAKIIRFNE